MKNFIGKTIRKIRTEKNLSQAALGKKIGFGVSERHSCPILSRIENGKYDISEKQMMRILTAMNFSPPVAAQIVGETFIRDLAERYGFEVKISKK
jgi:transcriptional regulator with XRE-family HTH domain